MNAPERLEMDDSDIADSWAISVTDKLERSRRLAWIVAILSLAIALLLAIAIVIMLPLKRSVPYTLLVDKETGYVQALSPLKDQTITPDAALTRSFLVQYVIARETFDIDTLNTDYRKVALWSSGTARKSYLSLMNASNSASPIASLPRRALIQTTIRSVSSLAKNRAMVRFTTVQTDPGSQAQPPQYWVAIIDYQYSSAAMSAADRLINPLGFQVTRYRKNAETLPAGPKQAAPDQGSGANVGASS